MDKKVSQLLDVVICGLNQKIYSESIIDEHAFYVMVIENGLTGLVYSALNHECISKQLHDKLTNSFYGYVARDAKQLEAISLLNDILNESQIDHIFLKGSTLKKLYPETYMRAMGDIDLLIREIDLKRVHEVLKKHQIKTLSLSKQHDVFEFPNKIIFEVHPTLYKEFNSKYTKLFEDEWRFAKLIDKHLYDFTHEFEVIYLTYHLAKHMDSSGIGIRSILDIGIYLNVYETKIDEKLLKEYLNTANMTLFYQNMIQLNKKYFQFTYDYSIHDGFEMEEDTFEKMTAYLIQSGIHGTGKKFNMFTSRIATTELRKQSRFKFVLRLFFPNFESMVGMYPFISKAKILIVFAWMLRLFKLTFKKTKSSIQKLFKLKVKKTEVDEMKVLFQKIGLS
jgi:hypothetical protein